MLLLVHGRVDECDRYSAAQRKSLSNGRICKSCDNSLPAHRTVAKQWKLTNVGLGKAARWKGNLLQYAADVFSRRGADLQALIYGQRAVTERSNATQPAQSSRALGISGNAGSDDDELFAPRTAGDAQQTAAASGD